MFRFNEVVQQKLDSSDSHGEVSFIRLQVAYICFSQIQTECLYQADLHKVFRSLNILSKVGWVINSDVLKVAEAVWERGGNELDIPSRTDISLPERVRESERSEVQKDFENERQFKRASAKIKQKNYDLHSLRCDLGYKLDIAREFQHDVMTKNRIDK